jgi:hypothetical protein
MYLTKVVPSEDVVAQVVSGIEDALSPLPEPGLVAFSIFWCEKIR